MTPRKEVLSAALEAVEGRGAAYGPPAPFFGRVAAEWSAELGARVRPEQVVRCLIRLKLVRHAIDSGCDSAVDIAGYAACLGEVAAAPDPLKPGPWDR